MSGRLCATFLMPHPPVLIPAVGGGREYAAKKTAEACHAVAARIAELAPDTIIVVSPHAPLFRDYLFVYDHPQLTGSFASFGAPNIRISCEQDTRFRNQFIELMYAEEIAAGSLDSAASFHSGFNHGVAGELDHGVLVPLWFVHNAYKNFRLLALSPSAYERETIIRVGELLYETAVKTDTRVCLIASGDMSHRVNTESPYGVTPEGAVFDAAICRIFRESKLEDLLCVDPTLCEDAGECGYRSLLVLKGTVSAQEVDNKNFGTPACTLYSYEAPFGIGYCVAGVEFPDEGEKDEGR